LLFRSGGCVHLDVLDGCFVLGVRHCEREGKVL
jgi:hypothetical protein